VVVPLRALVQFTGLPSRSHSGKTNGERIGGHVSEEKENVVFVPEMVRKCGT
jgi:hypothetical protein